MAIFLYLQELCSFLFIILKILTVSFNVMVLILPPQQLASLHDVEIFLIEITKSGSFKIMGFNEMLLFME